jgi:hypothetical protein
MSGPSHSISGVKNYRPWCLGRPIVALLLAFCACGNSPPEQVAPKNEYADQLKAMSELDRGLALRRVILDTPGGVCKKVEYSGYQQDYRNLPMWLVRCSDRHDWAVFIARNADVQVRRCSDLKALGSPECHFPPNTDSGKTR